MIPDYFDTMPHRGARVASRVLRGRAGYPLHLAIERIGSSHPLHTYGWESCWFVTDHIRLVAVQSTDVDSASALVPLVGSPPSLHVCWPTAPAVGWVTIPYHQRANLRHVAQMARDIESNGGGRIVARLVGFPDRPVSMELMDDSRIVAGMQIEGSTWSGDIGDSTFNPTLLVQMIAGQSVTLSFFPDGLFPAALAMPNGIGKAPVLIRQAGVKADQWLGLLMPRVILNGRKA